MQQTFDNGATIGYYVTANLTGKSINLGCTCSEHCKVFHYLYTIMLITSSIFERVGLKMLILDILFLTHFNLVYIRHL